MADRNCHADCWVCMHTGSFGCCVMPARQVCQSLHNNEILDLPLEQLWQAQPKIQILNGI